jgi:small-conductance mechanosensitive channel
VPHLKSRFRSLTAASWSSLAARIALCLMLAVTLAPVYAQQPTSAETDVALDDARKQIDAVQTGVADVTDDAELIRRRATALDVQTKADAIAEALAPQLTSVQARLGELGPLAAGAKEAADVAAQRAQLEKSRVALDAQVKLARLLSVEGGQAAEQISGLRRSQFQARLGERRASVVGALFWREFRSDAPRDTNRLMALGAELGAAAVATPYWVWIAIALAIVVLLALRLAIVRLILRLTATRVPPGRLRRSLLALALVMLATATPGLVAALITLGLNWGTPLASDTQAFMIGLVGMACFGGYIAGLGKALLSPFRSSWRLLPIPDLVALRMRWFPLVLAIVIVLAWVGERVPVMLNASLTITIAANAVVALVLGVTIGIAMLRAERMRRNALRDPETLIVPPRPFWLSLLMAATWLVFAVSFVSVLIGYVAFAGFVVKQVVWTLVVVCSGYLLSVLIEDGFTTLLTSPGKETKEGEDTKNDLASPRVRDQAAVLLSGLGRLFVLLFALVLLLAPFGEGPLELVHRADQLHNGLSIGEVQIRPGAVLQAVLVLFGSLLAVRIFKGWLQNRYLPTTTFDPGMQLSATTLFGYFGVVVSIALAMSAVGVGLERVAWVASALSVGIGFGLQAVVQNFVSGLILLAERPVKVGDWVSLGGVEGDILRINVRATEIQMGDRSTVIVPNSEFITKTVRNVTHSNPLGLVQIKLPMPLGTDAQKVRKLMQDAFEAHEDVLDTPAPSVALDGIDGSNLMFNASGFVSSPRAAYGVRSALLFDVLSRLNAEGMAMAKQNTTMLISAPLTGGLPGQPGLPVQAPQAVPPPPVGPGA